MLSLSWIYSSQINTSTLLSNLCKPCSLELLDELPLNIPEHQTSSQTKTLNLVASPSYSGDPCTIKRDLQKSISSNPLMKCFPFIFQCHTDIDVADIIRTSDYIKHYLDVLFVLSVLRPRADTTLQYFTPPQHNGNFFRERPARQALYHGKFGSWSPYRSRR